MKHFETLRVASPLITKKKQQQQQQQRMNGAHFVITEQRQKLNLSFKRKEEK